MIREDHISEGLRHGGTPAPVLYPQPVSLVSQRCIHRARTHLYQTPVRVYPIPPPHPHPQDVLDVPPEPPPEDVESGRFTWHSAGVDPTPSFKPPFDRESKPNSDVITQTLRRSALSVCVNGRCWFPSAVHGAYIHSLLRRSKAKHACYVLLLQWWFSGPLLECSIIGLGGPVM